MIKWIALARNKLGVSAYLGNERFTISVTRGPKGRARHYRLGDRCNGKVGEYGSNLHHHKTLAAAKLCAEEILDGKHLTPDERARVDLLKAIIELPEAQREAVNMLVDYIDNRVSATCERCDNRHDDLDSRIDDIRCRLSNI